MDDRERPALVPGCNPGEDRCRVRTGSAPQNLAAVRDTVISLFRLQGHDNIAEAHLIYADQPDLVAPTLHAA